MMYYYKKYNYDMISSFSAIALPKNNEVQNPVYDLRYTSMLSEFFYAAEEARAIANERSNHGDELHNDYKCNTYIPSIREEAAKYMNSFNEAVHLKDCQIL